MRHGSHAPAEWRRTIPAACARSAPPSATAYPRGRNCREAVSRSAARRNRDRPVRSEEHTSELQSPCNLVCRLLLEKKKQTQKTAFRPGKECFKAKRRLRY